MEVVSADVNTEMMLDLIFILVLILTLIRWVIPRQTLKRKYSNMSFQVQ